MSNSQRNNPGFRENVNKPTPDPATGTNYGTDASAFQNRGGVDQGAGAYGAIDGVDGGARSNTVPNQGVLPEQGGAMRQLGN